MAEATLTLGFAGPLVSVQDAGRPGHMRYGVAASGPMDRLAFEAARHALGPSAGPSGIEVSLGGLILECRTGSLSLAVAGADSVVDHQGRKDSTWTVLTLHAGEGLAVRAGPKGSWTYLAFAGDLQVEPWLGSHATHASSGFGGGMLKSGDTLHVANTSVCEDRLGEIPRPSFLADGPMRIVPGPQEDRFAQGALDLLLGTPFTVSDAYDRMGMRLEGEPLTLDGALSIPSEPIIRGSVQVSGDGVPTVLLADHQTTGGYPKIATLISCDTDRLAQHRAGDEVRFTALSPDQAVQAARAYAAQKAAYLEDIARARGTLEQRLMRENLNPGWAEEPS